MTDIDFDPIGTILDDIYLVLCYMGCGTFSSVWLCYDINDKNYKILKILPIENSEYGETELQVLKKISSHDSPYLNKLLHYFIFTHEKKKYTCLVFNLMAGSLQDVLNLKKYKNGLPIQISIDIIKQILQGLYVLHEKCNIIHADIKPENILLRGQTQSISKFIQLFESSPQYKKINNIIQNYHISQNKKDLQTIKKSIRNIIIDIYTNSDDMPSSDIMCDILKIFDNSDENNNSNTQSNSETCDESTNSEKSSYTTISDRTSDHGEKEISLDNISNVSSSFYDRFLCDKNCIINNHNNEITDIYSDASFDSEKENIIDDNYILINPQICIADFGNCYNIDNISRGDLQTRYYRSPEIILRLDINYACDIWALGCLFYELLTGKLLFKPSKTKFINRDKSHIYEIYRKIGFIPDDIINKSRKKNIFFRKDGTIKNLYCFVSSPFSIKLQKILLNNNHTNNLDNNPNSNSDNISNDPFLTQTSTKIISLLQTMLDTNHSLRYSAQQCLNHILFD